MISISAASQNLDNRIIKRVAVSADTILLDSNSIASGSFQVRHGERILLDSEYWVDPVQALFHINPGLQMGDSIDISYRRLPLSFSRKYANKDTILLETSTGTRKDPFKYRPTPNESDLFGLQGLDKSGSISRGVLFGNNQDLAVNSAFNLELAGKVTDKINVVASVTDNAIPIQANGNTLELQDFDQVFIKLYDDQRELIAGDMVLERPKSHFMNYFKKVQGLSYAQHAIGDGPYRWNMHAGGAISKGKFARNQIQGIENNQGPYRLTGAENEQFIIVLSGTEQIYIDGRLLVRGQENDYIIDYNTAELSFTAKQVITKDKRIVAEFQYSDRNYTRSLITGGAAYRTNQTEVRLEAFSEQDHKNQPFQQDLGEPEKQVLANAGDNPLLAVVSGVDSVGADNTLVLYQQVDSLGYSPVYVYSTNTDTALYQLSFTNVGQGNGDYIQDGFVASGRVFKWIAPDTLNGEIVHRGNHAPIRRLIAPKSQRMFILGVDHKENERTSVSAEFALTDLDRNSFSSIDNGDNQGLAVKMGMIHTIPLDTAAVWSILMAGSLELRDANFERIERYRSVEFDRNWNVLGRMFLNEQALGTATLGLKKKNGERVAYSLNGFSVADEFDGVKHDVTAMLRPRKYEIDFVGSLLSTEEENSSYFIRHKSRLARRFGAITLGYADEHELNERFGSTRDSLSVGSYQFFDWRLFAESPDSLKSRYSLSAGQRNDRLVANGQLVNTTLATNVTAGFELGNNSRNRLKGTFTYRQLQITNDSLTSQQPEDTYLGRLEYDLNALKGAASIGLFYELGAGAEQRREFIYVEVPAGQGVYVWNDYNGDGVRDLNEFEIANFGYEANYIRVFIPSNEYVTTYTDQLSISLDLRPRAVWSNTEGARKFLAKFSNQTSIRTDRRTGKDLSTALDFFNLNDRDSSIISYNSSARNSVYYDRTSREWSADFTVQNDRSKSNLVNGSEIRGRLNRRLGLRWNTTDRFTFNLNLENGEVFSQSQALAGRTYSIDETKVEPKLTWQPNTTFRASVSYVQTNKEAGSESAMNKALLNELNATTRLSTPGKGSLDISISWITIEYDGEPNNSLGNEMLQGLRIGNNATWTVSLQRNLSKNLQADLTYNGRRSEGNPVIHVGGVQLRAFF
jgi:hypothetical protein